MIGKVAGMDLSIEKVRTTPAWQFKILQQNCVF